MSLPSDDARKAKDRVPAAEAREIVARLFDYDPETGLFTRKVTRASGVKGSVAGTVTKSGYVRVRVFGRQVMAHRVAFLVMRGRWPANEVDHIDGNRANNRFANLREATAAENQRNAKLRKDNRVGLKGVKKNGSGYAAWIRLNNRPKYIGTFKTPEAAHKAYITVAETSYGDFARAA